MCDSLKFFVMKKNVIFNVNTNSRISFVPGYGMAKQLSGLSNSISRILKFSIDKKKKAVLLNLRSISFTRNGSLFFITQYDL